MDLEPTDGLDGTLLTPPKWSGTDSLQGHWIQPVAHARAGGTRGSSGRA